MTKEFFVKAIEEIKKIHEFENTFDKLFHTVVDIPTGESVLIKLLEESLGCPTNDLYGSDISYFIYDLEFGTKWEPGMITEDGKDIDLSTAEKLYDYLCQLPGD